MIIKKRNKFLNKIIIGSAQLKDGYGLSNSRVTKSELFQILNFAKKNKDCCIEGRDISSKILPKSNLKFFFICNINVASKRRYKELKKINPKIDLKNVKKALRVRNLLDKKRKNSPLLKHRDSVVIDTGKLNKQSMLKKMSFFIDKELKRKYGN